MEELRKILHMFFSRMGEYEAGGLFSIGHFLLLGLTVGGICLALNHTLQYSYQKIRALVKRLIVFLSALEIMKIYFNFHIGNGCELMSWVPLYFCTICIYAGWLSCFCHGTVQHLGDVFLATGSLIGGICFLLYPSSSIMLYPTFHFLTIHSFLYHGMMVFIGILMNRSGLVQLQAGDLKYYMFYVTAFCMLAWAINLRCHTNFMFISDTFPGTLLDIPYRILGPLYTPVSIAVQAVIPFEVIRWFKRRTDLLSRPAWYDEQPQKQRAADKKYHSEENRTV
ncbi:MAG: YwaF family protein [Solobacterium sp.]|jgi:hypothetical protein|nr:YwaF family protein [Solobacterium sp.]MCH4205106.1 YwaF family protein [Solobacterium sp.]MCH4226699.1 YwaF family protein [Solobacterium sp.]MCH4281972.1 YwaF family protein [Solobacterium sp.]